MINIFLRIFLSVNEALLTSMERLFLISYEENENILVFQTDQRLHKLKGYYY